MAPQLDQLGGLVERFLHELHLMRPLWPTYVHLIVSAIFPIYIAAHASLTRPSSAAPATKKHRTEDMEDEDEETEEASPRIETLTPSDALLFPVMAGAMLATLYFALKFFKDPAWLNWFLGVYFAAIGFFFMMRFFQDMFSIVRSALLPRQYSYGGKIWYAVEKDECYRAGDTSNQQAQRKSPLPSMFGSLPLPTRIDLALWKLRRFLYAKARLEFSVRSLIQIKLPVEALDSLSLVLTAIVVIYHTFIDKPWYLTNLLGFSFCYGSLQFMTPGTPWTGSLLLAALFCYDIYFVFFTPMMVTVATKLDVPIKLLFPRPGGCVFPVGAGDGSEIMVEYLKCIAKKRTMAMLGLGDIVVPGMMLAFALRFDLYLFYLRKQEKQQQATQDGQVIDSNTITTSKVQDDLNAKSKASEIKKPAYAPATGYWGERFWVSTKFHTQLYQGKKFPKTYFYATITGYVIGMITTVMVMQIANHAQPALLYLVPGVLISLWGTALVKGDLKLLWEYSEVPEDESKKEEKKKNEGEMTITTEPKKRGGNEEEEAKKQEELENSVELKEDSSSSLSTKKTPNLSEIAKEGSPTKDEKKAINKIEKFSAPANHLFYLAIVAIEPKTNSKSENETTTKAKSSKSD